MENISRKITRENIWWHWIITGKRTANPIRTFIYGSTQTWSWSRFICLYVQSQFIQWKTGGIFSSTYMCLLTCTGWLDQLVSVFKTIYVSCIVGWWWLAIGTPSINAAPEPWSRRSGYISWKAVFCYIEWRFCLSPRFKAIRWWPCKNLKPVLFRKKCVLWVHIREYLASIIMRWWLICEPVMLDYNNIGTTFNTPWITTYRGRKFRFSVGYNWEYTNIANFRFEWFLSSFFHGLFFTLASVTLEQATWEYW